MVYLNVVSLIILLLIDNLWWERLIWNGGSEMICEVRLLLCCINVCICVIIFLIWNGLVI